MRRQQGIALISVLLVMSLALLIVGSMLRKHRLVVQSTGLQLQHVQMRQVAFSAERRALGYLHAPDVQSSRTVHLAQDWAQSHAPVDLDGHLARIQIEDLGGRFNLTSLVAATKADTLPRQRWLRLLDTLRLRNPQLEDLASQGLPQLSDISQLRLLPGVDAETLRRLQPMLALLPKEASLNLNTADAEQLMTLGDIPEGVARTLVQQRPAEGYRSVQAFVEDPLLEGLELGSHGLGLSSRWFRITVDVVAAGGGLRMVSEVELDEKNRQPKVLQRRFPTPLNSEPS